jgi:hypothetical protein
MLELSRELSFYVFFQAPKNEWPDDAMEPSDHLFVLVRRTLNHAVHRIRKPKRKLFPRPEDVGHQKVQKGPQLHQVVL